MRACLCCGVQLLINSAGVATWDGLEDVTEREMMDIFRCTELACLQEPDTGALLAPCRSQAASSLVEPSWKHACQTTACGCLWAFLLAGFCSCYSEFRT